MEEAELRLKKPVQRRRNGNNKPASASFDVAAATRTRIASAGGVYVARVDGVETVLSIGFGCAHGPEGDALTMNWLDLFDGRGLPQPQFCWLLHRQDVRPCWCRRTERLWWGSDPPTYNFWRVFCESFPSMHPLGVSLVAQRQLPQGGVRNGSWRTRTTTRTMRGGWGPNILQFLIPVLVYQSGLGDNGIENEGVVDNSRHINFDYEQTRIINHRPVVVVN